MASIPKVTDPGFPDVHVLEEGEPVVGGLDGVDNRPHRELAERTEFLKAKTDTLAAARADHEARLNTVEVAGSISVGRAFGLWSGEMADFELFSDHPYVWRDIDPRAIVQTVAGDESVDVESTAGLRVGDAYVIRDADGSTEVVEVAEVLSAQRLRATATLARSRDATGTLARTSWDVRAGHALAQDGGVLYARPVRVLRYDDTGRVLIRRDAGDGTLALAVRDAATGGAWTDCPLATSTAAPDAEDRVDLEYQVPTGGVVAFRLTATTGPSGAPIRVDHILALPPPDAVRDLVRRPVAVAPAEGAVDVSETPLLETSAYYSLYGVVQADLEVRVATDPLMTTVIHTATLGAAGAQVTLPAGVLATDGRYWWDARHRDAEGQWSLRSEPAGFSCASTFTYVSTPTISTPAEGATGVSLTPTITTSAFAVVGGEDTHAATRIQIATDAAFSTPVVDATLGAVTEHTLDAGQALARDTLHHLRVRHEGTALGAGGWSTTRAFRTANAGDAPVITSPAAGATIPLRPTITLSAFAFPGGGEAHVASQYRVTSADGLTTLYDSGEVSDLTSHTLPSALPALTAVRLTARQRGATTGWTAWATAVACATEAPSGEALFTSPGSHAWTVPDGVTEVSVVCVGGGGDASGGGSHAGSGGGTGWRNATTVAPGQAITVVVGGRQADGSGGTSSFGSFLSVTGGSRGGVSPPAPGQPLAGADGGGAGGEGRSGGGGAGGYEGDGGRGSDSGLGGLGSGGQGGGGGGGGGIDNGSGAGGGGGVGLQGRGSNGAGKSANALGGPGGGGGSGGQDGGKGSPSPGNTGGIGGNGGDFGGGGGDAHAASVAGAGGSGAVRVIWGPGRSYPDHAA
ncbi:hypothetical protein [Roseospira visakhapatnamensis]|uniref:Uncharacterized protein n=1 Tax=Roseospira visakhapatnamensis TaxID=390880 RepID=A0A7W6WAV1_9PROT|nr:hypothetical protein [Roseospira visakhapatnamensis]MBB4266886.1 hypothetical protein [Roseospira visakhapatnamensis]